ncbi:tripartite tricarboxylate transporter TctB family protein [Halomonas sp. SpR1]|uniref:tripartite tricarboxylate transporter TctB family protein n=1 Tax=Halomonas sp. SpR1 TaxID=3050462 RepID=UPI0027E4697F|nr:tripartite tricarboxylate transporter TctB family protein [Halomonas sp. SpR1]MDQ7734875.1 tripartite tricarboxylate transporter TctB family protein [Halomonas sp. SpR1]
MKTLHIDVVIGLAILLFSIVFYSLSAQIPADPAVFPKLILSILALFSLLIIWTGVSKTLSAKKERLKNIPIFKHARGPAVTFIALCVYLALINLLGFFTASSLAAIFFMFYFGVKSYIQALLVVILMNTFVYLLFVWQLRISLPTGLFI